MTYSFALQSLNLALAIGNGRIIGVGVIGVGDGVIGIGVIGAGVGVGVIGDGIGGTVGTGDGVGDGGAGVSSHKQPRLLMIGDEQMRY